MSSIGRRLERVAEAISHSGYTCDGQGSVLMVRFVGPGHPVELPARPGEPTQRCLQYPLASGSSDLIGLAARGWKPRTAAARAS